MAELWRHDSHGHDLRAEDQVTVAELITELQRLDQTLEVKIADREDGFLYGVYIPTLHRQSQYSSTLRKFVEVSVVVL